MMPFATMSVRRWTLALAALLLISAHMAFWRIVLSSDFINSRL